MSNTIHSIQSLEQVQDLTEDRILTATILITRSEAESFSRDILRPSGYAAMADRILNVGGDRLRGEVYRRYLLSTHLLSKLNAKRDALPHIGTQATIVNPAARRKDRYDYWRNVLRELDCDGAIRIEFSMTYKGCPASAVIYAYGTERTLVVDGHKHRISKNSAFAAGQMLGYEGVA
jgi:hypothetical protein